MMPHLPDEMWLQIFSHLPAEDTWLTLRPLNRQLRRCAEDYMSKQHIEKFTIGLQTSLGSGSHHRWYDIRGTITFTFKEINKHNPQYALFGSCLVHPQSFYVRAMEQWKRMSSDGLGERQEWRVQHGYVGEAKVVRLPKLVIADGEGIWCDWREMFNGYYGKPVLLEQAVDKAWGSRPN